MRGKRISTGTPKSGTEVIANRLLQAGLNPDTDVQAEGDLPHVGCQEVPFSTFKVAKVSFTRPGSAWRRGGWAPGRSGAVFVDLRRRGVHLLESARLSKISFVIALAAGKSSRTGKHVRHHDRRNVRGLRVGGGGIVPKS